ncbi:MAG: plasmid mobilization protein [Thermoanaerobaculia bacterium]
MSEPVHGRLGFRAKPPHLARRRSGRSRRRGREPGKPGRPRKPAEKLRSKRIRIRVSEIELALLEEGAAGMPLPRWIRERLLGEPKSSLPAVPPANREIAGQLAKLGNNLNQLVRLAHTGRLSPALEPLLREIYRVLARYQRELLGGPR